jgi:hypothetical protein
VSDQETAPVRPALESAMWIDVRACLALTRAMLKGLRAAAPEVRAVVVESLKDEAALVELEGARWAQAVAALIDEARHELEDAA